jgi:hypothetical protein
LILRRPSPTDVHPVHVTGRASDGRELARQVIEGDPSKRRPVQPGDPLSAARPEDIQSVEVIKGNAAACSPKPCSRILVTLKPGATLRRP